MFLKCCNGKYFIYRLNLQFLSSCKRLTNHDSTVLTFSFFSYSAHFEGSCSNLPYLHTHIVQVFEVEMHYNQTNGQVMDCTEGKERWRKVEFLLKTKHSRLVIGRDGRTFHFGSWQAQNVYKCVRVRRPWLLRNPLGMWYQLSATCNSLVQWRHGAIL